MTRPYIKHRVQINIPTLAIAAPQSFTLRTYTAGQTHTRIRMDVDSSWQVEYPVSNSFPWGGFQAQVIVALNWSAAVGPPPVPPAYFGYENDADWLWVQQVAYEPAPIWDQSIIFGGAGYYQTGMRSTLASQYIDSHAMRAVPAGQTGVLSMILDSQTINPTYTADFAPRFLTSSYILGQDV